MKRLLRSWVFWVFVLPPPLVTLVLYSYRVTESYVCTGCLSDREVTQWRLIFGDYEMIPLGWERATQRESRFLTEVLPPGHAHRWRIQGGDAIAVLVESPTTFWAGPEVQPELGSIAYHWESVPEFRDFLRGMPWKEVVVVLLTPREPADPEGRRLTRLGEAWMSEFHGRTGLLRLPR